jgi:HEAT repeat protein
MRPLSAALASLMLAVPVLAQRKPEHQGRPLSAWLEQLRAPAPEARLQAALALRDMDARDAASVVPALASALGDASAPVRAASAQALQRYTTHAAPALPQLVAVLGDPDAEVQKQAALALEGLGEIAVPALSAALRSENVAVRSRASRALWGLGPRAAPAVADLVAALEGDPDPGVRSRAAEALGAVGPKASGAVPALARALDDDTTRSAALGALAQLGSAASPALDALLGELEGPRAEGLGGAGVREALAGLGSAVIPPLVSRAQGPDPQLRVRAIATLAAMGPGAVSALPALSKALEDPEPTVRRAAVEALRSMGAAAAPAVPALAALLADDGLRVAAAEALAGMGGAAAPALGALMTTFKSAAATDPALPAVRKSLVALDSRSATPIAELLNDEDPALRVKAITLLEEMGPAAKPALPGLLGLLQGDSAELGLAAGRALAKLGSDAVPNLIEELKSDQPVRRAAAARVLGEIGAPARAAVSALTLLAKDPDASVQAAAAEALTKIGVEPARRAPRAKP